MGYHRPFASSGALRRLLTMNTRTQLFAAVLALPLLSPTLAAQSFATQITALTPLVTQATLGAQTTTTTVPVGALPGAGQSLALAQQSVNTAVSGNLSWSTANSTYAARVGIDAQLQTYGSPPAASASVAPSELLVEWLPNGAPGAVLEVTSQWAGNGAPTPAVQIDLGNDGVFDLTGTFGTTTVPVPTGQVYQVRVVIQADLPVGALSSHTYVTLEMRPDNRVQVTQTVDSCSPTSPSLLVLETFVDHGIVLQSAAPLSIGVVVIGFAPLLAPLPIPIAPGPCLLLPAPDVLVVDPLFGVGSIPIALPPAVRPVTFYVQAVAVSFSGVLGGSSPGYTVDAL